MNEKTLSKADAKKYAEIVEEDIYPVPFTTPFQEEVQTIVKKLWNEEDNFFKWHGKYWLNDNFIDVFHDDDCTVMLYSKAGKNNDGSFVYKCSNEEGSFRIKISNFEKYSQYSGSKIHTVGIDKEGLVGIAIIGIIDMLYYDFIKISELHQEVIKINRSNLDIETKKRLIRKTIQEVDSHIEKNSYKFNFSYSTEIIELLNDMHIYHEWIEEGNSFVMQLALEAYQEITYYNEWLDKHKIEEKRFREKISKIMSDRTELRILTNAKPPFQERIPQHPQDILHGLVSNYWDFFGTERKMSDEGIQTIIKIISDYKRMPKKSKQKKELEYITSIRISIIEKMKDNNATEEEIGNYLFFGELSEEMEDLIIDDIKKYIEDVWLPFFVKLENSNLSDKEIEQKLLKKLHFAKDKFISENLGNSLFTNSSQ